MNKYNLTLLFLVCFVPFIGYFANPLLGFDDSYAFLSQVCGIEEISGTLGSPLFKEIILPLIPCNIFLIKLILFTFYFASILFIALAAENIVGKERGWRVALVSATLTPLLFFESMKFENDIFGWCLSFLGFWCISFLFKQGLSKLERIVVVLCAVGIAFFASLLYTPSILMVLPFVFIAPVLFPFLLIALYLYLPSILSYIQPTGGLVGEEMMASGLVWVAFLLPFTFDVPKRIKVPAILLLCVGFFKAKFMLFAVPFLAFGLEEMLWRFRNKKFCPNLVVLGLVFSCVFAFMAFTSSPTQSDMQQVSEAIGLAKDLNVPLYNDWDLGWWITYQGYPTSFRGGYPDPDWNNLERPFVALTREELACRKEQEQASKKTYVC